MKRNVLTIFTFAASLTLSSTPLCAQGISGGVSPSISQKQLRKQINEARTPEQYGVLATYFHQKENSYRAKTAEEKTEWERRKQIQTHVVMKYPIPADSARNLYDYYSYEAAEMATMAAAYERLSVR